MAAKHGLQYNDFEKVFQKYDDQICRGEISPQEFWDKYQDELLFQDSDINFLDYWVSKLSIIPETHKLIRDLVHSNISVGLLTNIYSGVFEKSLSIKLIPDVKYNSVIKSCEIKVIKPEKEIYLLA